VPPRYAHRETSAGLGYGTCRGGSVGSKSLQEGRIRPAQNRLPHCPLRRCVPRPMGRLCRSCLTLAASCKAPVLERRDDWVFRCLRCQNTVNADAMRGGVRRSTGQRSFPWPSCGSELQLKPLHNFLRRVAVVRSPVDQATPKRCTKFIRIFGFAIDCDRQTCPAAQRPCCSCIAENRGDHGIEQANRRRTVAEGLSENDPALMVAGARLDQPRQLKTIQTIKRHLCGKVIE